MTIPTLRLSSGGCHLGGCHLGGCHLGGCHLGGCRLGVCHLGGCHLGDCHLRAGCDPVPFVYCPVGYQLLSVCKVVFLLRVKKHKGTHNSHSLYFSVLLAFRFESPTLGGFIPPPPVSEDIGAPACIFVCFPNIVNCSECV